MLRRDECCLRSWLKLRRWADCFSRVGHDDVVPMSGSYIVQRFGRMDWKSSHVKMRSRAPGYSTVWLPRYNFRCFVVVVWHVKLQCPEPHWNDGGHGDDCNGWLPAICSLRFPETSEPRFVLYPLGSGLSMPIVYPQLHLYVISGALGPR